MMIALQSLNEMQKTASMRLSIIPHGITVIYVTYFQIYLLFNAVVSVDYGLRNEVCRLSFSKTKLY